MDGRYRFENVPLLENRRYYVDVVWSQSPGLVGMRPADGSADWYAVEVPSTWQNPDPLAGWTPNVPTLRLVDRPAVEQRVSITGVAFEDRNRDGVRQACEPPVRGGVSLDLLYAGASGTARPLATVTTQVDGRYAFSGLSSSCDRFYAVRVGFTGFSG